MRGELFTASGRMLSLVRPEPGQICAKDVARGLARMPRWGGQTNGFYALSVAQHSILVSRAAEELAYPAETQLAGLVHDAAEYLLHDLPTPAKDLCPDYVEIHDRVQACAYKAFGLPFHLPDVVAENVRVLDRWAAAIEAVDLFPKAAARLDCHALARRLQFLGARPLKAWPAHTAETAWLQRLAQCQRAYRRQQTKRLDA